MKSFPLFGCLLHPRHVVLALSLLLLLGCSDFKTTAPALPEPLETAPLGGTVFGGQQPLSGAHIYMFSVAGTFKGASTSMLSGTGVTMDGNGDGYVTTNSVGGFTLTSLFTCPAGNTAISTYFLATGGFPGTSGTSNAAISMMAAVGPCSGLGTTVKQVVINEVSTVASVTALQQFMADALHIGASTINPQPGYSAVPNISNAMIVADAMLDLVNGTARATTPSGTGTAPQATIDTLGNILAGCVNSTGSTSTGCLSLFMHAKSSAGVTPGDTLTAMLNIAQNPGTNVATLMTLGTSSAPFMPALTTTPNDFTLGITYTTPSLTGPLQMAIDNAGNVWIANCASCTTGAGSDAIVGFSPAGVVNTTNANYTNNVHSPVAIALDRYNGIWIVEQATQGHANQVTRLSNTDGSVEYPSGGGGYFPVTLTGSPSFGGIAIVEDGPSAAWILDLAHGEMSLYRYDGDLLGTVTTTGLSQPESIAADGLENLYIIGNGSSNVLKYSPIYPAGSFSPATSGTFTTLSGSGAGVSNPYSLAVDGGDHLWTLSQGNKGVSELFGYNGTATSGATGYDAGNITKAQQVTIDGAGTAWIANCRNGCDVTSMSPPDNIVHLTAAGVSAVPSDGIQNAAFNDPAYTAIDPSGNLWVGNELGSSVTELVGVAVPVVTELETASSRHALGAVNYLVNGSFDLGGTGNNVTVPGWTFSSASNYGVDTGAPFSGPQKLTFYSGSPYTLTASQTVSVPNGNYLVSCYAAGAPGSSTQTEQIQVTGYGGSAIDSTLTNASYTFQPFSVANVTVTTGTMTVGLYNNETYSGGGYAGWDSCSVTAQ